MQMTAGVGILTTKLKASITDINLCGVVVDVLGCMIPVVKVGRVASYDFSQTFSY